MSVDDETLENIAVYMRENLPVKSRQLGPRGKMHAYFSGKRFVDFLLASKFSKEQDEDAPIGSRDEAIAVAKKMMQRQNFFRGTFSTKKVKKRGEIKEKKIVLIVGGLPQAYDQRLFVDKDEPFVWTYDPVTKTTLMYGLMLLGGVCMCAALPLWPMWLRNIVIYFLLFILVGRPGIWLVVWLATFSRWNFYILPNLDEDISFEKRFSPIFLMEKSETAAGNEDEDDEDGDDDGDDDGTAEADDDDANDASADDADTANEPEDA